MKKFITEKENKESVESNYVSKRITQVFTISSMNDGIFNEELRHKSMIIVFPPQCEGPMTIRQWQRIRLYILVRTVLNLIVIVEIVTVQNN